ncbi:MAG: pyrimidine-nucleoside phosphorylase [Furfurilactobacillus sp.]|uniref:Pyrimidine-nucleoside phosphorylase n=1 Tax=Furfurilactobacillus milii TaxID=2888272 RepID=A0ABT6D6E1_9LACO|nr:MULTISPECIES: pyrimidine-nucleoside phosphorylase [Furfurilactobacillus]QLE66288.1 Pyrimidine-nucleoside phosphorylase [Furfurilactobacillus rossiae]MCF6159744.1 pyrimidine-nucleoside phosphorylase [Furfurilactobacillus milii]MCF6163171.1 pyrimidine-nucleoside phosphorylase [Furfurilactobacillus milii]MCF6419125.1 pyrimidine-nucleoside phosphorylase [Furfurilactobacillus milii]MCH4011000.1 pyrimidine-nucleoside phosphorylase [Furfurilactobacillus sp.]
MRMVDVIDTKRNGGELTTEQIEFFINGYTKGDIPDYQVSALLMAIYLKGMTKQETATMTMTMLHSGDQLDLSDIHGVKVDKHSTGGVGDKTSIPLAPLVASVGIPVPMISGRGLGHTGGTLDKLEAIPGLKVEISEASFKQQLRDVGCAIVGATGNIAPADKKIYALRDVTDTVDSIPLIAGSIMSKKIASGTDALVLDVKTGSGAFMKTEADSVALAKELVGIGKSVGMNAMAVISDMNQPLGNAIGNALEIEESIALLKGNGPADLLDLVLTIGSQMVVMANKATDLDAARKMLQQHIDDGSALTKFKEMIIAQGGDGRVIENPAMMPQATYQMPILAARDGVITKMKADEMGIAAMMLGGGRQKKDDQLDYAVGLTLSKKVGDEVHQGDTILTIHSNREDVSDVQQLIEANIAIGDEAQPLTLIHEVVD